ncbi:MAG: hypothetical protein WHV66_00755 [Anaerolineales bacterium]|jgi:DNA mismatch repair ATPase MutS
MKAFLMYKDRDFDLHQKLPVNAEDLTQDLELNTLFNAMARGDKFLLEVAKTAVLCGADHSPDAILYRQAVLKDCLKNSAVVREIYAIAIEALERERKVFWGIFSKYPDAILHRAVEVMLIFVELLKRLKTLAEKHANEFDSEGFRTFFDMINRELNAEYFAVIQHHLRELKFRDGVLISARLGKGNRGEDYVLRKHTAQKRSLVERVFSRKPRSFTFYIAERDENGYRALSELKDRGINLVANALAQSTEHILSFFTMLRTELAFYVGCLNLHEQLIQKGVPVCFPQPAPAYERRHSGKEIRDVCLVLTLEQPVVGNDLKADGKNLVIITGANQGGKSTFLRGIGLAQLMMQCGMFVTAEAFSSNLCDGFFTHFKREEDVTMKSGKLDEELSRMSNIIDQLTPNAMLLLNESFAATNEREGSEIARQIISALLEKRIKVFYVTHLYDFASRFYRLGREDVVSLRAERGVNGERTFKLVEGEPLPTSFGKDLYAGVFENTNLFLSSCTDE